MEVDSAVGTRAAAGSVGMEVDSVAVPAEQPPAPEPDTATAEEGAPVATVTTVALPLSAEALAAQALGLPTGPEEAAQWQAAFGEVSENDLSEEQLKGFDWCKCDLREHQVNGINWLISAYRIGLNVILADEMGLGKTVQTITYLGYLKFECGIEGPSLIVAPLSVLSSWVAEFERWCPRMRVVRLHTADNKERELLRTEMLADVRTYDVVLTTYEMAASQNMQSILCGRMSWRYLVLDEGHRIKNERTIQYERLRHVRCQRKLLLTGTPLQNNMHELWALMHFLHPALFAHAEVFDSAFDLNRQTVDEEVLHKVHELLGTFVLRRVKADVLRSLPKKTEVRLYVPMSRTQQQLSKLLLLQDGELLDRMRTRQQLMAGGAEVKQLQTSTQASKDWNRMQSLLMSLRKCCNHPHLFPAMTRVSERLGETLATASGKLCILDRLLRRLFADGHRVVLFSFFTSMLDILEQYFDERNIPFVRLDGSTNPLQRAQNIDEFNAKDSTLKLFLCSTRAGGLGINLTSADTVVLYDSDFNPQVDIQAQDRVHRIGQLKPVRIFRLVTRGTVEERIVSRASQKLYLERMVVGGRGGASAPQDDDETADEVLSLGVSRSEVLAMLGFSLSGALDGASLSTKDVTDQMIEDVLTQSFGSSKVGQLEQITIGVGGIQPMAAGTAGSRPSLPNVDAVQLSAGIEPGVLEELRAFNEEEDGEEDPAIAAAALAEEEAAALHEAAGGRSKRKRNSRFIEVDGYMVLKLNDYTLEDGEPSVWGTEQMRDKPKQRGGAYRL